LVASCLGVAIAVERRKKLGFASPKRWGALSVANVSAIRCPPNVDSRQVLGMVPVESVAALGRLDEGGSSVRLPR
jgi:hypothetical protein